MRRTRNIIPPKNTNAFFEVGEGKINLFSIRDNIDDYRFDLFLDTGKCYTGYGDFQISGDIIDIHHPYRNFTITENTTLSINQSLTCSSGEIKNYGHLILQKNSILSVKNNGKVIVEHHSTITFDRESRMEVEDGSQVILYGLINIHIDELRRLRESPNVVIDSSAILNVSGINIPVRIFSLTDYILEMHGKYANIHTQGEKNYQGGRIGYTWKDGSPYQPSQVIDMITMFGRSILGDFRLSILGEPKEILPKMQIVNSLHIRKKSTLYLTTQIEGFIYHFPELYLGKIIGNSKKSGECTVEGRIIAEKDSVITIDRLATMRILPEGEVHLKDNAIMRSAYNEDQPVLFIEGKLYVDSVEQLVGFKKENIVFGEKGKLVVVNPSADQPRILLSIPEGIQSSLLYELFKDRLEKVEFHFNNKTGILIDKYYDSYNVEMRDWYGGMRLEKAIKLGMIVWHSGAYIELRNEITKWIGVKSTLLAVGKIFKAYGMNDKERLQDIVKRLISIGCESMKFRFVQGLNVNELTLNLDSIKMLAAYHDPLAGKYVLLTDDSGVLYLRNKVGNTEDSSIFTEKARVLRIPTINELEFVI